MPRSSLVLAEVTIVVATFAEELGAVHSALERLWESCDARHLDQPDGRWRAEFGTAVVEIGTNIVKYAHPQSGPPGEMCLRLRLFGTRIEARFADNGVPYYAAPPAQPAVDTAELAEGGYGLMIAHAVVDRLRYRRTPHGTNVWWLLKSFAAQPEL